MNEELDSQLSAMFDNELPAAECELLARRLSRDRVLQARWGRYAAIGAAVRGEGRLGGAVARGVSGALAAEAALPESRDLALQVQGATLPRWWRPVAGVAVAASVATLAILWLQQNSSPATVPLVARAGASAMAPVVQAPLSYVVPRTLEPRAPIMPATELANYVVAHSQFSTPVSRGNLLSALMASESAAAGAPEQLPVTAEDANPHAIDSP